MSFISFIPPSSGTAAPDPLIDSDALSELPPDMFAAIFNMLIASPATSPDGVTDALSSGAENQITASPAFVEDLPLSQVAAEMPGNKDTADEIHPNFLNTFIGDAPAKVEPVDMLQATDPLHDHPVGPSNVKNTGFEHFDPIPAASSSPVSSVSRPNLSGKAVVEIAVQPDTRPRTSPLTGIVRFTVPNAGDKKARRTITLSDAMEMPAPTTADPQSDAGNLGHVSIAETLPAETEPVPDTVGKLLQTELLPEEVRGQPAAKSTTRTAIVSPKNEALNADPTAVAPQQLGKMVRITSAEQRQVNEGRRDPSERQKGESSSDPSDAGAPFSARFAGQTTDESNAPFRAAPAAIIRQIEPRFVEVVSTLTSVGEKKVIRINLKPEELGSIRITLEKGEGDKISARFQTDTQDTRSLIHHGLEGLKDSLERSGFRVADLAATCSASSDGGRHQEQHRPVSNIGVSSVAPPLTDTEPEQVPGADERLISLRA